MSDKSTFDIWKEIDAKGLVGEERLKAFEEALGKREEPKKAELVKENTPEAMAERFGLIASEIKAPIAHKGYNYLRIGILAMVNGKNNLKTAMDMYEYIGNAEGVETEIVRDEIVKLMLVVEHFMTGTPSIVHKENKEAFEKYFKGIQAHIIDDAEFVKCIIKAVKEG